VLARAGLLCRGFSGGRRVTIALSPALLLWLSALLAAVVPAGLAASARLPSVPARGAVSSRSSSCCSRVPVAAVPSVARRAAVARVRPLVVPLFLAVSASAAGAGPAAGVIPASVPVVVVLVAVGVLPPVTAVVPLAVSRAAALSVPVLPCPVAVSVSRAVHAAVVCHCQLVAQADVATASCSAGYIVQGTSSES
jgi:hypothetical protein